MKHIKVDNKTEELYKKVKLKVMEITKNPEITDNMTVFYLCNKFLKGG